MEWPNFEHAPLKPDGLRKNKKTGKLEYTYTMDTWHRECGKNVFRTAVESHSDDLHEGPSRSDLPKEDTASE